MTSVCVCVCLRAGSRDSNVNLWNTVGVLKYRVEDHDDWVTCVAFSPKQEYVWVRVRHAGLE